MMYLILLTLVAVCIVQPYKNTYKVYNKLDIIFMICLGFVCIGVMLPIFTFDKEQLYGFYVAGVFSLTPLVYLHIKIILYFKCQCFRNIRLSSFSFVLDSFF